MLRRRIRRPVLFGCWLVSCIGVGVSCGAYEDRPIGTADRSVRDTSGTLLVSPSGESPSSNKKQFELLGSRGTAVTLTRVHSGEPTAGTTFYDVEFPGHATVSWGRDDFCRDADGAMAWIVGETSDDLLAVAIVPKWFASTASLSQSGETLTTERFTSVHLVSDVLAAPALDAHEPPTLVGVAEPEMGRIEGC
jgi:hypothetical protein